MNRLSAEQTDAWLQHVQGLIDGHPEIGHREFSTGEWVIDVPAWPGLRIALRELHHRGRDELVDGYPRSSMGGGAPSNEVDDDGTPIPPRSDPTGAAVLARAQGSVIDDTLARALDAVLVMGKNADLAKSLVMKLQRPLDPPKQTERIWCQHHLKFGMQEPINSHGRGGDCQWCTAFRHTYNQKPPRRLLEMKSRGERIYQRDIDQALPKKRRKAS